VACEPQEGPREGARESRAGGPWGEVASARIEALGSAAYNVEIVPSTGPFDARATGSDEAGDRERQDRLVEDEGYDAWISVRARIGPEVVLDIGRLRAQPITKGRMRRIGKRSPASARRADV
jgi:hypothetical protein